MWVIASAIGLLMLVCVGLFAAGWFIAARHVASQWPSLDKRQRRHSVTVFTAIALLLLGCVNGIAFFTVAAAIGGNADKVEGDRYYVSSHGRLTEVSQSVWIYSDFHGRLTWATSLLAAMAIAVFMWASWKSERARPSLTITIARDGAILVDETESTIEQAIDRAELAKARREPIYLKRAYPPNAAPANAVKLHYELIGHDILFQAVEHTT